MHLNWLTENLKALPQLEYWSNGVMVLENK